MRAGWLCLAAAAALTPLVSGCGGVSAPAAAGVGDELTVYTSLPLHGSGAPVARQVLGGEKVALADAGGRAGRFRINIFALDDSSPKSGQWDPGATASNATTAAQENTTIAYIGDLDSGATAVSLPLINAAGILQVSPVSPYVGLTSSTDAGEDEPDRFYMTGTRNFVRLAPGDLVEAAAQVRLLRLLHVRRVYVANDLDPFNVPLAELVAGAAHRAGIEVIADDGVDTTTATTFTGEVEKIASSGAQALFYSGAAGPGATAFLQELHSADPSLLISGSSTMDGATLASELGAQGGTVYRTTPTLAPAMYPPAAARVLQEFERRFREPSSPYVLYGYEAMSAVLAAVRAAGPRGNNRDAVIRHLFALRDRESVLGRYSVQPNGETTLSRYGIQRLEHGRLRFWRAVDIPPSQLP
ncbi:MAG: ABC transporter substrate-binding protein [Solirubrobacterales bacterium]|nr:ABC transporter substrate-binding protein [Solirubrobacterales bacterium]